MLIKIIQYFLISLQNSNRDESTSAIPGMSLAKVASLNANTKSL